MKPTRYAWLIVALLWVVWMFNYLDRQVIFSIFPLLQKELTLSNLQLGLLGTSFLWIYAAFSPFCGYLSDRYGRKLLVVASLFVWSLVTWATAHARGFTDLLWARAFMGISEACYLPAGLALVAAYHGERTRSKATGLHQSGSYAGTILGGLAGGWIGQSYGWRSVFAVLGAAGVIYTLVVALGIREPAAPASPAVARNKLRLSDTLRELFSLDGFGVMTVAFSAVSVGDWAVYAWMPTYLYERFHMSLAQAGFSATFYLKGGGFLGLLLGGALADWWGARTSRGRLYSQSLGLIGAAPFLFFTGLTNSSILLVIALAVYGFGKGMYDANVMPVLCQVARPGVRSTGYGVFNMCGCIAGGAIAAVAGGLKNSFGLGGTIQFAGILLTCAGLALLRIQINSTAPRVAVASAFADFK
jgi:MFS family permease